MCKSFFYLILISLLVPFTASAQDAKIVKSQLRSATVYYQGAELTHTARTAVQRGENEILVEDLSPSVDRNSLRIKTTGGAIISSYEYTTEYIAENKNPAVIRKLEDSVAFYKSAIQQTDIEITVNRNTLQYLQSGVSKTISQSETGLEIDDLMKTINYYDEKSREMEKRKVELANRRAKEIENLQRLEAQLAMEAIKDSRQSGVLKLNLSSPVAGNVDLTVTYYTASAGWTPAYEIIIENTDRPVKFAGKAKVRQVTGMDWKNVSIALSTSTPGDGRNAPLFSAWYLRSQPLIHELSASRVQNSYSYEMSGRGSAKNYKQMESAVDEYVALPDHDHFGPIYIVDGIVVDEDYVGQLDPSMIKSQNAHYGSEAQNKYGNYAAGGVVEIILKSGMDDFITAVDSDINVVYNIELPYSIPGNGKIQTIDLSTIETDAVYKYYCAPKLDPEVYILAEISQWQKLGLLTAMANITFDGNYIGTTAIDASSTDNVLSLTLGVEKRISVKREKLLDFSSSRTIGNDRQQDFRYRITVRNNMNKPVKFILKEQYPLSSDKNIQVTLNKDITRWTANVEDLGVITWEEEFQSGETKVYETGYSVRYPKTMNLNL